MTPTELTNFQAVVSDMHEELIQLNGLFVFVQSMTPYQVMGVQKQAFIDTFTTSVRETVSKFETAMQAELDPAPEPRAIEAAPAKRTRSHHTTGGNNQ